MSLAPMARMTAPPTQEAAVQSALDIVPYSCSSMRLESLGAMEGAAPGQIVVMAWPYITLDDAKVQQVLDGIYGGGAGGAALIQATGEAVAGGFIPAPPTFIATGWMRDAGANQSVSRGTLWIAVGGWSSPVTASAVRNYGLLIMSRATGVPVQAAGSASATIAAPVGKGGIPKVADDASDVAAQMAAVRSAAATVGFFAALAAPFSGSPLNRSIALTQTTRQFNDAAAKVTAAIAAADQIPAVIVQAGAASAAAIAADTTTCTAAVAALDATTQQLNAAKAAIQAGLDAAVWLQQYVQAQTTPGGGDIVRQIRDQVVAAVNGAVASDTMAITREYMKCVYFQNARRSLDAQLKNVGAQFADAQAKAALISANSDTLMQRMAAVDAQVAANATARNQSCLDWYMKDFHGYPVIAWVGGGAAVVLGTAVIVKARRKKTAPVTPNARRRSRTSRRAS